MKLVWKLLRRHISIGQMGGFCLANLFGMFVILLSYQFYVDVLPCFTAEDSFMKNDYVVVSKKIAASDVVSGRTNTFSPSDIDDLKEQPFVKSLGLFVSNDYHVNASMAVDGTKILNSEVYLESVPDEFLDVDAGAWHYNPGDSIVPILLPRSYMTMYNFGFAKSHSLPSLSDGILSLVDVVLYIQGNGKDVALKGRLIGFSNKINGVMVPQSFMTWSNQMFSAETEVAPSRLIMKVDAPGDKRLSQYFDEQGYDVDSNQMDNEKTAYFLKVIIGIVMGIGLLISVLSFYILMLSIFLLVQKNAYKLENLLLIGYSVKQVALPYQMLTVVVNLLILIVAIGCVSVARMFYVDTIQMLYPAAEMGFPLGMIALGVLMLIVVSLINVGIIYRHVRRIWGSKCKNNGNDI